MQHAILQILTGHQDNAEFALAMCPTEPYVLSGGCAFLYLSFFLGLIRLLHNMFLRTLWKYQYFILLFFLAYELGFLIRSFLNWDDFFSFFLSWVQSFLSIQFWLMRFFWQARISQWFYGASKTMSRLWQQNQVLQNLQLLVVPTLKMLPRVVGMVINL